MNSRPELPPLRKDETVATFGSARNTAATCACRPIIASKEMSCDASVLTRIWPMSSSGKKPLGMVAAIHRVSSRLPTATAPISQRWRSAQSSVRP
jgi:hypothetical protein